MTTKKNSLETETDKETQMSDEEYNKVGGLEKFEFHFPDGRYGNISLFIEDWELLETNDEPPIGFSLEFRYPDHENKVRDDMTISINPLM